MNYVISSFLVTTVGFCAGYLCRGAVERHRRKQRVMLLIQRLREAPTEEEPIGESTNYTWTLGRN